MYERRRELDAAYVTIVAERIRQSFEGLNVLPNLFDRFVARRLGLSGIRFPTDHRKNKEEHDGEPARYFEVTHSHNLHEALIKSTRYSVPSVVVDGTK